MVCARDLLGNGELQCGWHKTGVEGIVKQPALREKPATRVENAHLAQHPREVEWWAKVV